MFQVPLNNSCVLRLPSNNNYPIHRFKFQKVRNIYYTISSINKAITKLKRQNRCSAAVHSSAFCCWMLNVTRQLISVTNCNSIANTVEDGEPEDCAVSFPSTEVPNEGGDCQAHIERTRHAAIDIL